MWVGMSCVVDSSPRVRSGRRRWLPSLGACALAVAVLLTAPASGALAEPDYTAARKAGRGAAGMFLGVVEIPGNIARETRKNGPIRGATVGLIMGVGMTIVRTCVGTYELFTAPLGFPNDFEPVIDPEFSWEYFTERQPGAGGGIDDDIYETY